MEKTTIERYDYMTTEGCAVIEFVDGVFAKADFPFKGSYSRDQWGDLAKIAQKIQEIEHEKADSVLDVVEADHFNICQVRLVGDKIAKHIRLVLVQPCSEESARRITTAIATAAGCNCGG